jgi:fibrillarin-like pre-rRNA processing protein
LVFSEKNKLYTLSSSPGTRIYGEKIVKMSDQEYREWNPRKSKLAAYIRSGGEFFPIRRDSKILYLGASSGTTASHMSDIASEGRIYCVEFAPRMFRDLVKTCFARENMFPILGDATNPEEYQFAVGPLDMIYADVAQKRQADIIADNMDFFRTDFGMAAIKARSEDVTANPAGIYRASVKRLEERGYKVVDSRELEPFENAHCMLAFTRK